MSCNNEEAKCFRIHSIQNMLWVTQTNHRDRSLRKLWWKANLHKHSFNNNTKDIDNRIINVIQ